MDRDRFALRFAEVDRRYVCPGASDPTYLDFLNGLIDRERIDLVHAQPDPEVWTISQHRKEIRAKTFLPEAYTVRGCQNKYHCYKMLVANDVPVPKTVPLPSEVALNKAWDLFMPMHGWGGPASGKMWVRANSGAAGNGAYLAQAGKYEQVRSWIESQNGWGTFMASEYLPGRCVTWQSLWSNGHLVAAQGRERLEWYLANRSPAGVTGVTGVARTISRADVTEVGMAAVMAFGSYPNGIFGVDMKENAEGRPCVTEINIGRFFTTIEFFTQAGLNFPDLYVRAAMGEDIPTQPELPEGLMWIRSMDSPPQLISDAGLLDLVPDASEMVVA